MTEVWPLLLVSSRTLELQLDVLVVIASFLFRDVHLVRHLVHLVLVLLGGGISITDVESI